MLRYSFTVYRPLDYINGGGLPLKPSTSFDAPALTSAGALFFPNYPQIRVGFVNPEKSPSRASPAVARFMQVTATVRFMGAAGHPLSHVPRFWPGAAPRGLKVYIISRQGTLSCGMPCLAP
jgi:hypothetical protein